MAVTGGGASAIARLLSVPGASKTLLEASVPYNASALAAFLRAVPDQACSARTARQMAMAAYARGLSLVGEAPLLGLGATAALATDRKRRGEDRCFIALQGRAATRELSMTLDGALNRAQQEEVCSDAIIGQLALALGLEAEPTPVKEQALRVQEAEAPWQALLQDKPATDAREKVQALLPGAFDPLHDGHLGMARLGEARLGCRVHLEISVRNVDKPPLDYLDMADRRQAAGSQPLVFTNAPTFLEKARLFPGAVFLVGADTLRRISEPRYYGSRGARDAAIDEIAALGNRFLAFGRLLNGRFQSPAELDMTPTLAALCDAVAERDFRLDLSSSRLRRDEA